MTAMDVSPRGMNVNRLLIGLALAGLLVACTDQGTGESDQPIGSAASSGAVSSESPTGSASAACEEAFAPIADMGLTEFSELGDLADEVEATVEGCESVADWTAGAQGHWRRRQSERGCVPPRNDLRRSVAGRHADLRGARRLLTR